MEDVYSSEHNNTGITPRGFKILVEIPKVADNRSGLYIPLSAQQKQVTQSVYAKVLELGHLCYQSETGEPIEPWCMPGDMVAMAQYGGTVIPAPLEKHRDRNLRLISQEAVDGVVTVMPYAFEGTNS